jgi:rare lipoprotein A
MKKVITWFFLLAVIGLVSSQITTVNKQKVTAVKDTIKKNKIVVEQEAVQQDTSIVETGSFKVYKKNAHASYYANKFTGKRTASGKKFDNNKYTAAHKKFPFGTKLKITNEANGKFVVVEVIDRGPFVRTREIDLTKRAFMEIAQNKGSGQMIVTIEVLEK